MHRSISGLRIFTAIFTAPVISSSVHFIAILACNHKSLITSAVGACNRSCAYPMKTTWQGDCFAFPTWEKTTLAWTPGAKKNNNSSLCDSIRSHLFVQKHILHLGCSYDNKTKHMLHILQLLILIVEGVGSDFTHGTMVPGRVLVECQHFRVRAGLSHLDLPHDLYTHREKESVPSPVSHTRSWGSFCRLGLLDWSFQAKKKKKKAMAEMQLQTQGIWYSERHLLSEMCWFLMSPGSQAVRQPGWLWPT